MYNYKAITFWKQLFEHKIDKSTLYKTNRHLFVEISIIIHVYKSFLTPKADDKGRLQ